jgi:hypothetical protein
MRMSASTHRSSWHCGAARLLAALGVASALLGRERPAAADPAARPIVPPPEVIIEKNSRVVAALPFGAGQLQNGELGLGVFFASSEALAAAASLASAIALHRLADADVTMPDGQGRHIDVASLNQRILEATLVNRISFGTWAALAVIGVIEAEVNFVPERLTLRKRQLTGSTPTLRPLFSVDARGGELGIVGRF